MKFPSPQNLIFIVFLFSSLFSIGQNEPGLALIEVNKAKASFEKSTLLFNTGLYDKALEAGLQTLDFINKAEQLVVDNPIGLARRTPDIMRADATNSVGIIYQALEDTHNAIRYLEEASVLYRKYRMHRQLAFNQVNFAMVFLQEEKYKDALIRYKISQMILEDLLEKKPNKLDSFFLRGHNQFSIGFLNATINTDTVEVKKAARQMKDAINYMYKSAELIVEREPFKYKFPSIILQASKLELERNVFENKNFIPDYIDKSIAIYENSIYKNHPDLGKLYGIKALLILRHSGKEDLEKVNFCSEKVWQHLIGNETRLSIRKKIEENTLGIKETGDILFAISNQANVNFELYQKFGVEHKLAASYEDVLLSIDLMDAMIRHYSNDANLETILNRYSMIYQFATTVVFTSYQKNKTSKTLDDLFWISEKQKSYVLRKAVNRKLLMDELAESEKENLMKGDSLSQKLKAINYTYNILKTKQLSGKDAKNILYQERVVQQKYNEWVLDLEKNNTKLYDLLYDNKVVTKQAVKTKIRKDQAAILEFSITHDKIITLLITPQVDTVFVKSRTHEMENKLKKYYQSLAANYQSDNYRKTAFDVYQFLFQEIDEVLKEEKIKRVYLVPDGILHTISFNAMLSNDKNDLWYNSLSYLLYDYEFSRHFSATSMLQNSEKKNLDGEITFGGFVPDYDLFPKGEGSCENLIVLKGALTSTEMIQQNFKKGDLIASATLKKFEIDASKYDILHLSMHSCLNYENPNLSSLVFTFENVETPFELRLAALYNKTITAELVVLSACNTGGGKFRRGEGLMSFNRAFFYAGSKSVVSSLWEANNESTKIITNIFYKNLVQRKMRKDQALTEALRSYAQKNPQHPSKWANFIIMGNLDQLSLD